VGEGPKSKFSNFFEGRFYGESGYVSRSFPMENGPYHIFAFGTSNKD